MIRAWNDFRKPGRKWSDFIMKNIAIITARSGSKGLPDKNIRPLNGIPLIAYTIRAAVNSGLFETVMVSTDSEKYAEISRSYGAEVPFLRSEETSCDTAGSWDVVREVLAKYSEMGKEYDRVCLLQPTSPLRDAEDLISAFRYMDKIGARNLISVVEVEHPVQWCIPETKDMSLAELAATPAWNMRRQDLPKYFRPNGAVFIADAKKIMDPTYVLEKDKCHGYIMPQIKSVDIDSILDFEYVRCILNLNKNHF